jgi:23S rRNA pseudouridine1911/1915/1917 synthase
VGRDPVRRTRMKVGGLGARDALTKYRVIRRLPHFTLIAAQPFTGRTHQIRVHFSSLGHPIVGDSTYGAPSRFTVGGREVRTLGRTFLHASELTFRHPQNGKLLKLEASLPGELQGFLESLEEMDR